ncbi:MULTISPECIES: hypothetical protein [Bacillus]|uniref:Uncharacterized protein n=1 Tax=Bacillus cereus (strain 03BB102) TaxID=572264 RepID=A0A158RHP8_BACC3|nr:MULTISPECIES: hypothetical protein [Bacillus]ACO26516.1 hypothetical protein BCA_3193 [Bacillus cereus 03BB102]AJG51517.1 hypothetical protein AS54_3183 [Bacillus cereus 03BB102]AJG57498.1 hypothetical protein AW22_1514 [Bacillus cereus D17]KXY55599.1 hypothetical protein AT275_03550 [Bacillus cereus]MBL3880583.1 hypothetical protein [Bacillus cereus]
MYTKPLEFQVTHKYTTTKTNQLNLYYQNILYINSFVSYMCEDNKILFPKQKKAKVFNLLQLSFL